MTMILHVFGYCSGLLSLLAFPPYLRDVIRGTTRPQRASWFIWSGLGVIAFASQWAEGARASLWMSGVQTSGLITTFLFSLWRGQGGLVRRDGIALSIAGVGVLLSLLTHNAAFALSLVIIAEAAGAGLTILKAYEAPGSETLFTWSVSAVAAVFGMLAVGKFSVALLAFPLYIFLANSAVTAAIILGRRKSHRIGRLPDVTLR